MSRYQVLVIGALPPPVDGMSVVTQKMLDRLRQAGNVRVVNLSSNSSTINIYFRFYKTLKVLHAAIKIVIGVAFGNNLKIYMPSDARKGLYYTLFLVALMRLCRCKVYLHHHAFVYLFHYDWRMDIISRIMAGQGTHILQCDAMKEKFSRCYPAAKRFFKVSNAVFCNDRVAGVGKKKQGSVLYIGHLSNLSIEKGLIRVIKTFRELLSNNIPAKLILAGQPVSYQERNIIEKAKREFGTLLEHRGAVYGDAKLQFYKDIDVFLFPSTFFNEVQPLVILDALSAGVPTIAYDTGCISVCVRRDCGLCVPRNSDFVEAAVQKIKSWHEERNNLYRASQEAVKHMLALHKDAMADLANLVYMITDNTKG